LFRVIIFYIFIYARRKQHTANAHRYIRLHCTKVNDFGTVNSNAMWFAWMPVGKKGG